MGIRDVARSDFQLYFTKVEWNISPGIRRAVLGKGVCVCVCTCACVRGEEESASRWGCRLSRCHAGQMPRTCSGAELPAFSSGLGPALRPTPAWRQHTLGHQVTPRPQGSHGSAPEDDRVNGGACSFSRSDEGPWTAPRLWAAARSCPPVLPPRRQTLACLLLCLPVCPCWHPLPVCFRPR